jgi:hypothetical protein
MKKIDKRSKLWKSMSEQERVDYLNEYNGKGLGDTVAKITEKTGIKKAVKAIFGDDCGCDERQEALNKMFPNTKIIQCTEYDRLHEMKPWTKTGLTSNEIGFVLEMHRNYVNRNTKFTRCVPCLIKIVKDMQSLHDNYESKIQSLKNN